MDIFYKLLLQEEEFPIKQNTYNLIQTISKDLEEAIVIETQLKTNADEQSIYKPREKFPTNFAMDMVAYADSIFTACHYRGFNTAGFDME